MLLGDVRLRVVSDGRFWLDGGAHFGIVPRALWQPIIAPDELHRVPMGLNCLLIESAGKRVLVDTGLGTKHSPRRKEILRLQQGKGLIGALEEAGVLAEDVDIVINTHLHNDHCGGNTFFNEHRQAVPTFPRAEYWIQRLEWADARYPNERTQATYLPENLTPLEEQGQLRLVSGDAPVTEEVRCIVTSGHTRAHQSVVIQSQGQKAIYLGDLAPWKENIERLAWTPAGDVEPMETIESKRAIQQWALEEESLLIFEHDPRITAGYLRRHRDRLEVEPVEL
jgi:glyoxylase-like metal-dependent hydrolase (beta-lactamase superfamily II)